MEKEKRVKKQKSKGRKIFEWIFTGFFVALLLSVAGIKIYQVKSGNYSMFGTQYPVVLTDSMEDKYMVGDVLIVKKCEPSEVEVGDDISFYWIVNGQEMMMTHMCSEVVYTEEPNEKGFHYTFTAHGINKQSEQCGGGDCTYQTQTFNEDKLIGKVTGKSGFLKFTNTVFQSKWSLIVLILIPALYIMVTSVLDLFKGLEEKEESEAIQAAAIKQVEGDASKASKPLAPGEDPLKDLSEKDKERLKKELLEELLKKGKK